MTDHDTPLGGRSDYAQRELNAGDLHADPLTQFLRWVDAAIAAAAAAQQDGAMIALAQFSMAPAKVVAAGMTKTPILTTPDSAVAKLKMLLA